ncbi:MAG: hypothetical protein K2Y14_05925 [Burkholderiales bacterium]|nr:hypothetical protein [Burkholderiales bacterium]
MAIPLAIGNKYVAAIIQSEGYTYPDSSDPELTNSLIIYLEQPNQRKTPVIVGTS